MRLKLNLEVPDTAPCPAGNGSWEAPSRKSDVGKTARLVGIMFNENTGAVIASYFWKSRKRQKEGWRVCYTSCSFERVWDAEQRAWTPQDIYWEDKYDCVLRAA